MGLPPPQMARQSPPGLLPSGSRGTVTDGHPTLVSTEYCQKRCSWGRSDAALAHFRLQSADRMLDVRWYHYVAYFFGGAFLANSLPHLGNGISGHAFQSPFASPPGVGLSSAMVNVLWGLFNLVVGYLLVCRVGSFNLRNTRHMLILGAGILIMSLMLAHTFGPLHAGQ